VSCYYLLHTLPAFHDLTLGVWSRWVCTNHIAVSRRQSAATWTLFCCHSRLVLWGVCDWQRLGHAVQPLADLEVPEYALHPRVEPC
jgi:hypothetical protein